MKNSIKILVTVSILFLMSFSMNAQTDDWTGEWNTKYGKLVITKEGKINYLGTFPDGKLMDGRKRDGNKLIGRYIINPKAGKLINNSLGKKGAFMFILSDDKKTFYGSRQSETDPKWYTEDWKGVKINSKGDRYFKN